MGQRMRYTQRSVEKPAVPWYRQCATGQKGLVANMTCCELSRGRRSLSDGAPFLGGRRRKGQLLAPSSRAAVRLALWRACLLGIARRSPVPVASLEHLQLLLVLQRLQQT